MEGYKNKIEELKVTYDEGLKKIEREIIHLKEDGLSIAIGSKKLENTAELSQQRIAEYINDAIIPIIRMNRIQISQAHDQTHFMLTLSEKNIEAPEN